MTVIIPLAELEKKDKQAIRDSAADVLKARMVARKIVTDPNQITVRELSVGYTTPVAGAVKDLTLIHASGVTVVDWVEDATVVAAAYTPSSILAANSTVPQSKCIAIFGFFDRTADPDLIQIAIKRGSDTLELYKPDACYVYTEEIGGMTRTITVLDETDPIDIQMTFKSAAAAGAFKYVGLYALIAEPVGTNVSAPKK